MVEHAGSGRIDWRAPRSRAWRGAVCAAALMLIGAEAAAGADEPAPTPEEAAITLAAKQEDLEQKRIATEKAKVDLAAARHKAIADAFPTGTNTGAVELKSDAGKAESGAMTSVVLNSLAVRIAADAREAAIASAAAPAPAEETVKCGSLALDEDSLDPSVPRVLLLAGKQQLDFGHWDQFRFRACRIHQELTRLADDAYAQFGIGAAPAPPADPEDDRVGGVATVGTLLTVGSKLLQLVTPDWQVSGIAGTATDASLAAAVGRAVAGAPGPKVRVYWSGQISKLGGSRPIFTTLDALDAQDREAAKLAAELGAKIKPHQDRLDAIAKKKKPTRADLRSKDAAAAEVARFKTVLTPLSDARAAYAALVKDLNGKDGEAALPINRVINEAAAARLLGRGGVALSVAVPHSNGSLVTRKSLFNAFSSNPAAWVSGSAGADYWAVRPADQELLSSGHLTCLAGQTRLHRVAALTNAMPTLCPAPAAAPAAEGTR